MGGDTKPSSPAPVVLPSSKATGTTTRQKKPEQAATTMKRLVPYSRNPNFVGRVDILDTLKDLFKTQQTSGNSQVRVSLCGLGGVGKTEIALEYVYSLQERIPAVSIFWVHASNAETFSEAYASIAKRCQILGCTDPKADVLLLVKDWLEKKANGQWLMVLDNANDEELFFGPSFGTITSSAAPKNTGHLADYLPECANGALLITTRNKSMGVKMTRGQLMVEVPRMGPAESEQFLRKSLEGISATSDDLSALSLRLCYLPLALDQAARFIQNSSMTVSDYLELLDESYESAEGLFSDIEPGEPDSETFGSVAHVFGLQIQKLEQQDNLALELLSFMSLFDCQNIPAEFLVYYRKQGSRQWSETQVTKALETLKTFSLIAENIGGNFDMHRLVQLEVHKLLIKRETIGLFRREALMTVSYMYPYGTLETQATCAALMPHANAVLGSGKNSLTDEAKAKASLLHCMAGYFIFKGRWNNAESFSLEAYEIQNKLLGENHPDTVTSMADLALVYIHQGQYTKAEKLSMRVIEIRRTSQGEDHPDIVSSMANLASVYIHQGRYAEAEELSMRVMEIRKMSHGEGHPDTIASMADLASVYIIIGRREEAASLQVKITKVKNQMLRAEHFPVTFDSRPVNPDHDSAYASASRKETLPPLSESIFEVATRPPTTHKPHEVSYLSEEIQSLASDGDDIGSLASDETANEGLTGKALIRVFLSEEPQFRALCEKALAKLGRQGFVENMRRLLKLFYKSLSEEAQNEAEKAVAKLLRSRRGRVRISDQLAVYMQQEEEPWDIHRSNLEINLGDKSRIENWLALVAGRPVGPEQEFNDEDIEHQSLASSSDDGFQRDNFPFISELDVFLRKSKSFRTLQRDFMLIFLPSDLRHILLSIPGKHIWLSQVQDLSISNRVKSWVEDNTRVRWNWWPLKPRKRMLQHGEARVLWQCTCGEEQWKEISVEQYELVERILAYSDEQPKSTHWCRVKREGVFLPTWFGRIVRQIRPAPAASASSAAQKYTPSGQNASTPPSRHSSLPQGSVASSAAVPVSSRPHHRQSPNTSPQIRIRTPSTVSQTESWILFGVQGASRTLIPSQIRVSSQATDYSIFQELKRCYKLRRGRLRLWFSIWRLEYCEGVKFHRLTLNRMVRDRRELPIDQDYQYRPRAPAVDAQNPPFGRHLFQALFDTCPSLCTWPIPHDCIPPPAGSTHLERIPKRRQSFEKDLASPIWGFDAVFEVSLLYVLAYHLAILVGPFAFWVWWLRLHPDDLQNATIPFTIVLGGLSIFWSGAGVLTNRGYD